MKHRLLLLLLALCCVYTIACDRTASSCLSEAEKARVEKEFLDFWQAYKKARMDGDIATALRFHPRDEKVLIIYDGKLVWLTYEELAAEMRKFRYAVIEDLEGPFVTIAKCGCCVWLAGKTRYVDEEGNEQIDSWLNTYQEESGGGGWQQTASSNSTEDPRFPGG